MKQDYCHFSIILDRSGSMGVCRAATMEGFDAFMNDQKAQKGTATVSLTTFDDKIELEYAFKDIKDVPKLELNPRGGTALLDAIGVTMKNLKAKIKDMPEEEKPEQVVIVIVTDGEENSSHEFTYEKLAEKIEKRSKSGWKFVFLGANQDAIATASKMNIAASNSMTYNTSFKGTTSSYMNTSAKMSAFRATKLDASMAFDDSDRQEAMEK